MDATIHIDGAARGNPGPAAYAVVLARPGQPVVEEAGTLGTATNNVAEYTALVNALHLAQELGLKKLDVYSDSELMVKQMAGEYRVKHPDLQPLYQEASQLRKGFEAVRITHVRREQNKRADALCNEALDGKKGTSASSAPKAGPAPKGAPAKAVTDDRVRADALDVLRSAARAWADGGPAAVPVEAVWEQLWSVLEDGGVLKKK
jgi:ribonuclease HI